MIGAISKNVLLFYKKNYNSCFHLFKNFFDKYYAFIYVFEKNNIYIILGIVYYFFTI